MSVVFLSRVRVIPSYITEEFSATRLSSVLLLESVVDYNVLDSSQLVSTYLYSKAPGKVSVPTSEMPGTLTSGKADSYCSCIRSFTR